MFRLRLLPYLHRRASSELRCHCLRAAAAAATTTTTTTTTSTLSEDHKTVATRPPVPPPIRVALTEFAGRGVFATRGIETGELIHSAEPLLTSPSPSLVGKVCYYCLRRLGKGANATSDSNFSCFCSERCRERSKVFNEIENRVDWSSYDDHFSIRGLKYPLMVKRLACMVISGAAPANSIDILQPAILHPETLSEMEDEWQLLNDAFVKGHFKDHMISFLSKQWYINVLARIRINAFRIELVATSYDELFTSAASLVQADSAVGNAVYMLPSFYNHDCDPNVHIIWIDNANAKLKALRDIEAGEELRICYIDASMEFEVRQKILLEGFGFHCHCLRCLSRA